MERIREDYIRLISEHMGFVDLYTEEFDRALAEHDREVACEAFDRGWHALFLEHEKQRADPTHPITDTNPHRVKGRWVA